MSVIEARRERDRRKRQDSERNQFVRVVYDTIDDHEQGAPIEAIRERAADELGYDSDETDERVYLEAQRGNIWAPKKGVDRFKRV